MAALHAHNEPAASWAAMLAALSLKIREVSLCRPAASAAVQISSRRRRPMPSPRAARATYTPWSPTPA